jgi:hypothetical protein
MLPVKEFWGATDIVGAFQDACGTTLILREHGACTLYDAEKGEGPGRDHLRRVHQPVMGYPSEMPGPGEALMGVSTNTRVTVRSPKPSARASTVPMRSSSGLSITRGCRHVNLSWSGGTAGS